MYNQDILNVNISKIETSAFYALLKDETKIKVGNNNNVYALQNANKSISKIIQDYPRIANRLNMAITVQSQGEFVVIGNKKYEVIANEPSSNSHLVGNGGENIYVVTLTEKEVNIYNICNKTSIDTLDL